MIRRYGFALLFLAVLVTPFVLRLAIGVANPVAPRDASAQPLIIITAHVEGIRREFADAFEQWHARRFGQRVFVDYRVYAAGDVLKYFEASRDTIFKTQGT